MQVLHKVHQLKALISRKPNKTVSQVREQPKTSSAAPPNTNTAQTPPEIKPETPANATAADTKAVADRVIYYLNRARANIGSGELKKLPRLTGVRRVQEQSAAVKLCP